MSQQGNQLGKERQKMYKNADRHEDLRRRRTECSVELRKQKRDDAKMKRRNLVIEEDDVNVDVESSGEGPQNPSLPLEEILKILTNNPAIIELRRCFEALRRHVSRDKCPPVDEVIRLNLVEAMVSALSVGDPKVVFEAAWGITNIVSGTTEQTAHAIHKGCLEPLVKLCYADDVKVAEQAVWALANITGDTPEFRDRVIAAGGLDALGHLTRKVSTLRIDFVRTIAWWYSNMCRHKNPQAPIEVLKALAHGLATMVAHEDSAVRQDATWAFSYMTDGPDCQIILPYQVGALDGMVNALDEQNDAIIAPTVRVLGNFATGADELTQILIDKGYLAKYVPNLLQSGRSSMTKETVWLVSNVFAGTRDQIKYMMGLNVLPHIMHIFATGDSKCKLEASWCISNLVQGGSPKQIMKIVENGFSSITDGLRGTHHVDTVINMLDSIMGILNTAETISRNTYATLLDDFEASGCLDLIEGYQQHQSENIYQKALNIVEKHFCENEDEDVVVNVHPEDPTKPEAVVTDTDAEFPQFFRHSAPPRDDDLSRRDDLLSGFRFQKKRSRKADAMTDPRGGYYTNQNNAYQQPYPNNQYPNYQYPNNQYGNNQYPNNQYQNQQYQNLYPTLYPSPYATQSSQTWWLDESSVRIDRMDKEPVYYVMKSILLGGGLVFSLLVLLLSICCRRGHFRGIRWYAVNLMLVNLIHIANMVISDETYGIHKLLVDQLNDDKNQATMYNPTYPVFFNQAFNAYKYFITNFDMYTEPIKRWVMCIYCFTTTFLALETVHRYRTNSSGLPHFVWFLIVAFGDLAPMAIFITMTQAYPNTRVVPNPYLSYHFIVLAMVTLALFLLVTLSTCICCCSGSGGKTSRSFGGPALAGVLLYVVATIVSQYTYGYIISYDLGNEIDAYYNKKIPLFTTTWNMNTVFEPMRPYLNNVAYANMWCLIAFSMLTSLALLLFVPGYRMCCRSRDNGTTNSVGDSGEHA